MTEQTVGQFADVSLVDRVYRQRRFHNDEDATVVEHERRDEIPEEIMEQIEPFVGDGNAHLTVSGSLSSSHKFHKAESFVSVSVTCNNSLDDIHKVHDIVRPFVQTLTLQDHDEMSLLRDQILPESDRRHSPEELKGPAVVAESKPKIATPPQRTATVAPGVRVGVAKPTFKR